MLRVALLTLLLIFSAATAWGNQRVALVIGNGAYTQAGALKNPANDAQGIATSLERLGFEVVLGVDQTLSEMRTRLYQFAQVAKGAELALFFYAGHGVQVHGQNYLLPTDAKLAQEIDLDFATIEMDLILKALDRAAKTKIIIMDACRDNPFAADLARSMGASRSSAIGRGLAEIKASGGSLIAFATDPGNVAYDGDGENSPFTKSLLAHLETPGLEINTLMQRVRTDVFRDTGERQRPWTTTSLIGEVFLSPENQVVQPSQQVQQQVAVQPAPAVQTPRSDSTLEIAVWQAAEAGGTAEDYQAYVDKFPDGAFAGLAHARMARLADTGSAGSAPAPPDPVPPAVGTEFSERALGMNRNKRREVQRRLLLAGFDPNGVDGIFGPGARKAIGRWQSAAGHQPTGYLNADQLAELNEDTQSAYAAHKADAAARRKAAARNQQTQRTYRASAYCSQTGVTGYGSGPDRDSAGYNAALDCVNRGGIPNCCAYGVRNLN